MWLRTQFSRPAPARSWDAPQRCIAKVESTGTDLNIRYIVSNLPANQHPDHDTICTFRRRFLDPLSDLFVQILEVAHQIGLVEMGDVAIDGSKGQAKAMIKERAERRYEAEKQVYDQKMADRAAKEKRTGKKPPGRKPKPPESGPHAGDAGQLY